LNKYIEIVRAANWKSNLKEISFEPHIDIHVLGVGGVIPPEAQRLSQVHGAQVIDIDQIPRPRNGLSVEMPTGDGLFTTQIDRPLSIRTADCLPILLYAKKKPLVMGLHAGWKGFVADIMGEGLRKARYQGFAPSEFGVFIGPAIGLFAFEVGQEVIEAFRNILEPQELLMSISKGINDRWHIDLQLAACLYLSRLGVNPDSINIYRQCTKTSPQLHSYRREGATCGHNFSIIKIKSES